MINRIVVSHAQTLPVVLKYTDIRSYVFTVSFVLLSVATPWVFHQFHLAGSTFLPMHIFVMMAGLLFGWRAGLAVGLLTPLASYAVSGMPVLPVLPQIIVEISAYGLIAGVLREKFNTRVIWALLGAMLGGRLVLLLSVLVIYLVAGESSSPLGLESNPLLVLWSVIKQGGPGIVLQIISIPLIIYLVGKVVTKSKSSEYE